jgi:hypothetical protein
MLRIAVEPSLQLSIFGPIGSGVEIALGQRRTNQALVREGGHDCIGLPPFGIPLQYENAVVALSISTRKRLRDGELDLDQVGRRGERGSGKGL